MPAQGHKLPGRVTPWWVSARPSPDAPRRLHLVELRPNAKGFSSHAQAPAASPQTRLKGLARLQAPDYNTWCVQAPISKEDRLIRCPFHATTESIGALSTPPPNQSVLTRTE
nr:unnamed protein product [Digitaria exilis]